MVALPVQNVLTATGASISGASPRIDAGSLMSFTSRMRQSTDPRIDNQRNNVFAGTSNSLLRVITMRINPKSVKWSQTKRITKKDTRQGSTFFHFNNTAGQNNDILKMTFSGNTGNLDLRGSVPAPPLTTSPGVGQRTPGATDAQLKLLVWHNLYLMTREPMLLADNADNVFYIRYVSPLFPAPFLLTGFFQNVLEFEENASKPHSRDYSFEFTVTGAATGQGGLDTYLGRLATIINSPNPAVSASIGTFDSTITTVRNTVGIAGTFIA